MNTVDIMLGIRRVLEHCSSPEAKKEWEERCIANKVKREADEKALEDGESTE